MKIAIIGTGTMGKLMGRLWAERGHDIMFGSRSAETGQAAAAEIGLGCRGGEILESAELCEVALLAVPWYAFTDIERAVGTALDGKVVLDCMNPFKSSGSLALGHKWSAGEEVAKTLHRAKVVKIFNHTYKTLIENPVVNGQPTSVFYCGNDDGAKGIAAQLSAELGFAPVDAGPIKNSRLIEPLSALWMQLAFIMHNGTEFAINMVPRDPA